MIVFVNIEYHQDRKIILKYVLSVNQLDHFSLEMFSEKQNVNINY